MKIYLLTTDVESETQDSTINTDVYKTLDDVKQAFKEKVSKFRYIADTSSSINEIEEHERNFTAYKNGCYLSEHIEIWYEEKELDIDSAFVYIRGDKDRGKDIIAELVRRGGINPHGLDGSFVNLRYYINSNGIIDACCPQENDFWVVKHYRELYIEQIPVVSNAYVPKDKELVWAWNDNDKEQILWFYNAEKGGLYTHCFEEDKPVVKFLHYKLYTGEYPFWAKETYKKFDKNKSWENY